MRATLIHNPAAGDGKPSRADLEQILRDAGLQVRYQSAKKDWKKALKAESELVIAAGGDGTVAKVLKASRGSDRPVAFLPIGTANNIARTAAALGDARDLVARWRGLEPQSFDIGAATLGDEERLFVEGAGGGLFADAIFEGKKHVEQAGSLMGSETDRALVLLRGLVENARPVRWEVTVDGADLSAEYLAVEAMNIRHVGPSVPIAPDADPGDGLLDVVFVTADDRDGLLRYLDERLAQHEVSLPKLTVRRARHLTVAGEHARLRMDDDLLEDWGQIDITVMPAAARVLRS